MRFFGGQNTIMWTAPIVALVGGGFLLARQYDFASSGAAAKGGARVTAGYPSSSGPSVARSHEL